MHENGNQIVRIILCLSKQSHALILQTCNIEKLEMDLGMRRLASGQAAIIIIIIM